MTQKLDPELWREFETELTKSEDIKVEFNQNLTPIQSVSLDQFWDKFLSEEFPKGSINQSLEKNFAVYVVQNKLNINQIKKKYQAQGWSPNALLGWIKKVNGGEIIEFSIGEIVNWCKEYKPELAESFQDLNKIEESEVMRRSDLKFPISHIPITELVEECSQIFGKEYSHLFKVLSLHLISGQIPEKLRIVRLGQIEIDLRDYLFLVYPTGKAKGNAKNLIQKLRRQLGDEIVLLTSMHEEQLIGKVINRGTKKKPEYIANKGHFSADEIVIDESKTLLCDRDKEIARNYLLIGMDKFQQNEIYKRLTENLKNPEEVLRYYPKFNALFGTQPLNYKEKDIILNGFLKRVTTDYLPVLDTPEEVFADRLNNKTPISNKFDQLLDSLKSIKNIQQAEWGFSEDFDEKFIECFKMLRWAGLYNNKKKRNYTRLVEWQLQDRLLRKSCLIAIAKDKTTHVRAEHIELAFIDTLEDFIIELEFVNDKIWGDLGYGSVWGTTNQQDKNFLMWLHKKKAVSEEKTQISIKRFIEYIMDESLLSESGARKKYYKLLENNLINSKQVGKNDSKVWLVNPPKGYQGVQGGNRGIRTFYNNLIKKHFKPQGNPGNPGHP